MRSYDVVGFKADADTYCDACAERIYGPDTDDRTDREGNPLGAIFTGSEWDYPVHCRYCDRFLPTSLTSDGYIYALDLMQTAIDCDGLTIDGLAWRSPYADWIEYWGIDAFPDLDDSTGEPNPVTPDPRDMPLIREYAPTYGDSPLRELASRGYTADPRSAAAELLEAIRYAPGPAAAQDVADAAYRLIDAADAADYPETEEVY